jgi:hypothetical protein
VRLRMFYNSSSVVGTSRGDMPPIYNIAPTPYASCHTEPSKQATKYGLWCGDRKGDVASGGARFWWREPEAAGQLSAVLNPSGEICV